MKNVRMDFAKRGFAKIENLISRAEVERLRVIYDALLRDRQRTAGLRSDLGGDASDLVVERITQIMRPSMVEPALLDSPAYQNALTLARKLLGDDVALDFDMLINKAPHTDTPTPWHQDAAYWIELPDTRAVSIWIALDEVDEANGCMWFIPRSDKGDILEHTLPKHGGALFCKPDTRGAEAVPLHPGDCTAHDGFTLHFSEGNRTDRQRRALILNFRPQAMIELERAQGVDHTGKRKVRQ